MHRAAGSGQTIGDHAQGRACHHGGTSEENHKQSQSRKHMPSEQVG